MAFPQNVNRLLAALPASEFKRLSPHLELVHMLLGEVLCESGSSLQHVYFPITSIVSLYCVTENGVPSGVAEIGNDGILGIAIVMGGYAACRALVVSDGYGYRLRAQLLMEECNRGGKMQQLLLRYTRSLIAQTSGAVAYNCRDSTDRKLCRSRVTASDGLEEQADECYGATNHGFDCLPERNRQHAHPCDGAMP